MPPTINPRYLGAELLIYLTNHVVSKIPAHWIRLAWLRRVMRISVGDGCAVFLDCKFDTRGNCKIGRNSVINEGCRLDNRGGISIGDNVSLSSEVAILTASHIYDSAEFAGFMKSVEIRDRAWIGIRATIMPGVIIGKGAVVAAGSVVTRSVDEYTIVAGVPAKKIGMRNEKLSYQLSYKRLFH